MCIVGREEAVEGEVSGGLAAGGERWKEIERDLLLLNEPPETQ